MEHNRNRVLSEIRAAIRERRWPDAKELAFRLVAMNPIHPQGWLSLAEVYALAGKPKSARLAADRGAMLDPEGIWHERFALRPAADVTLDEAPDEAPDDTLLRALRVPRKTVAAAIIAKDEERCIARCLRSLEGAVDEIVLLDTGSSDRTVDIASQFERVSIYRTTWKDSFAAARNEAMKYIRSDWVLWIDADEWLHPEDREQVRLAAGLYDSLPFPAVLQVWHLNRIGDEVVDDFSQSRMFALRHDLRYWGRIHNQIGTADAMFPEGPIIRRKTRIRLYHDGYDPAIVEKKRKSGRAMHLLRLCMKEEPENPMWPMYLGRELFSRRRFGKAKDAFAAALKLAERRQGFSRVTEIRLFLVRIAMAQEDWKEAERWCERMLEEAPDFPDAHYYLAQALIMQAKKRFREAETFAIGAAERAKTYRGTVAADRSIRDWRAPVLLADLAVHRGKLAEARAIYRAYAKKAGTHEGAVKKKLAFIERQRKKLEQAGRAPKPD